ncbi:hypothetical protein GGI20_002372 [Coemansia sp. BCRC 34301]|nr:hypothetical protein GGI20_002372 [Coemansia sp. BCRC 34301]
MPHILPGKGIHKLSLRFRNRVNTLKRRKRSYGDEASSEQQEGEGDDVDTGNTTPKRPPMRIDIVHPHTYESGVSDLTAVRNPQLQASPPMNYWLNDENSDSDDSAHTVDGHFVPRRPAPQPIPIAKNNRFRRKEWQERADGALFGSHRRRPGNKLDDSPVLPRGELLLPTHSLSSICLSSSASSSDMRRWDSGIGGSDLPEPLRQRGDCESGNQEVYHECVAALNELLFATNAQIDEDVQALIRQHLNGQSISPFIPVFEGIVNQAFADFSVAARSTLAVADHANARPRFGSTANNTHASAPGKFTQSTQSLLAGIVSSYIGLDINEAADKSSRPSAQPKYSRDLDPLSADSLERLLQSFDINVVKYSKEQMRLFAITGLTKYVTNQVLLSTGVENDLIDKLEEAGEALALTMDQIEILDSLSGPSQGRRKTVDCEDIAALRLRAAQHKDTVDRIQLEAKDYGYTRRVYESILAEIKLLD